MNALRIPDSLVDEILKEVCGSLASIYNDYVSSIVPFADYCCEILDGIRVTLADVDNLDADSMEPILVRRWRTKKRWLDRELSSEGAFHKEVEVVAKELFSQLCGQVERFRAVYECDSYEELKALRVAALNEWANDSQALMCSFPYLRGKQRYQIERALRNDLEYIALRMIRERCPSGMQAAIFALPNSMINVPIDFTNRARISEDSIIERGHEKYFVDKYFINDTTFLENLMNVEILKTGVVSTVLKTLNATDVRIFLYLMSLRDENFYTTRQMVVDIGGIVRNVFASDSKYNYMTVKESLYRMQHLNSGAIDSSLRGFTVRLFDKVDIRKVTDGKEVATIIVSIDIVNEYVKHQTINMYRHIIDKFNVDAAKVAIFALQRERIRCSAIAAPGEPLVFKANLNFFRSILYFSNKKKKENIKLIETMLTEIVNNYIAVKHFERTGDTFLLEFYAITAQERRDLLSDGDGELLLELPYEQMARGI